MSFLSNTKYEFFKVCKTGDKVHWKMKITAQRAYGNRYYVTRSYEQDGYYPKNISGKGVRSFFSSKTDKKGEYLTIGGEKYYLSEANIIEKKDVDSTL